MLAATALLTTTVAGLGAAIYGLHQSAEDAGEARSAAAYLRANSAQLRQDLALGAGPTLDDLAAAAVIPREHRGRFGRVLQRHRVELLALGRPEELTAERALRLLERIGELVKRDPLLRHGLQAFLARASEPR